MKIFHLPPILSVAAIAAAFALLSGCYTLTQGTTMLGYLSRAIPLEQVSDSDFVHLVADIRSFAMNELGLAESKNYTRYVELDRNYLAAIVSASDKASFDRYEWNYPVVGRLPYKGFFNVEGAHRERNRLQKLDLDVWIRSVDAFSTLGWFRDPLYSYMRSYSIDRLAELIIHELVHATVFIKGHANFNEELAQFIGDEGARLYMETRYGLDSDEYRQMLSSEENSRRFVAFLQELIAELETLYSNEDLQRDEILIRKEQIINAAKERFDAEYESRFTNDNYRNFSTVPVNNAYLELFRLYYTPDNFYEDLFERTGRDLPAFVAAAKTIKRRNAAPPRTQLENALTSN
ncbi:MAG: aminopeptidase [Treponema sp.]|nr:aminopeptidase [Treponema sp.]MCL2236897.1 aminopeptidase [Treponema sp.]